MMSAAMSPQDFFTGVSGYHVSLILFMRCYSIVRPIGFEKWHRKLSKVSIPIIWSSMVIIILVPNIVTTMMLTPESTIKYRKLYASSWHVVYHGITTFPTLLILFLFLAQMFILNRKRNDRSMYNQGNAQMRSLEMMIRMVSLGTFICYLPNIIWKQWSMVTVTEVRSYQRYNSTGKVSPLKKIVFFHISYIG